MTIGEVLKEYHKVEIELLLAHVLKQPKEFVFLHPEYNITNKQLNNLKEFIKRRQKGEPIAYILGRKDFYGSRFKVDRRVLIPRPETEVVIDLVSDRVKPFKIGKPGRKINILDVGTGSGCIIVSIAKQLKNCQYPISNIHFFASDISAKALTVARYNAKRHHARVKFIKSDLLESIKPEPDILVANLPYGWKAWKNRSSAETVGLKFEPQQALFTGENGLYLYRKLLEQLAARPKSPQEIFLEIDPRQKKQLSLLVKEKLPQAHITLHKDQGNRWRYVQISR